MIQSTAADVIYILESSAGNFQVGSSAASAAQSPNAYSQLKDIRINLTGSGALVYVAGVLNPPDAPDVPGISGNFKVNAKAGTALAVEIHDGFTVKGKVQISAPGATLQSHWTTEAPGDTNPSDQFVDGVFLDPNRRGSYGSVQVNGGGTVGLDGVRALGNVNVNLGSSTSSSFVIDREWVDREDPDSPPWTKFQQDPTTISGNLTVTGGNDVELYNTNVAGRVAMTQSAANSGGNYNALLGGDSFGSDLTIRTPGGGTSGVFVDFTSVGRDTSITQTGSQNVLALQSTYFGRKTTLNQGAGQDNLLIDSETALQTAAALALGSVPTDSAYLKHLKDAGTLPPDSGSRFLQAVTAKQSGTTNSLVIGQDKVALTSFATASSFTAASGSSSTDLVNTTSVPPTFVGYTSLVKS
jgi:hypothetical protein